MAQLRIYRKRDEEAKGILQRVVARTLEVIAQDAEDQSIGAILADAAAQSQDNSTNIGKIPVSKKSKDTPSIEFRMQTARFLTELCMWRESVKILEGLKDEDDENVEAWYLLAFAFFRLRKYATAEECCANVGNLITKFKIIDPDLEAGVREIHQEILKQKAKAPAETAAAGNDEDEDWATDSEEDIDGDEDEDEEMKDG